MSNPKALPEWFPRGDTERLFTLFASEGEELRFVGGCIRDGLMQKPLGDLDAATTALPDKITEILEKNKIRAVPTGIAHGTVTAVFPERSIEITTLRKDTACDGRHASVEYTDNWEEDAARRDFTINALYLDSTGTLYDYFEGQNDLAKKTIRFIGNAEERIEEDYLRILRFFRFLATHGSPPADAEALAACAAAKDNILKLSGERIQKEMLKLLSAENPIYALEEMNNAGVLQTVLGTSGNIHNAARLIALEHNTNAEVNPFLRLAILLLGTSEVIPNLTGLWKLSRIDSDLLKTLSTFAEPDLKRMIRFLGKQTTALLVLRDAVIHNKQDAASLLETLRTWDIPVFPISGDDLIQKGLMPGKELGNILEKLEQKWEDSDYTLDKTELLKML